MPIIRGTVAYILYQKRKKGTQETREMRISSHEKISCKVKNGFFIKT